MYRSDDGFGVLPGSSRPLLTWKAANFKARHDDRPCRKDSGFSQHEIMGA